MGRTCRTGRCSSPLRRPTIDKVGSVPEAGEVVVGLFSTGSFLWLLVHAEDRVAITSHLALLWEWSLSVDVQPLWLPIQFVSLPAKGVNKNRQQEASGRSYSGTPRTAVRTAPHRKRRGSWCSTLEPWCGSNIIGPELRRCGSNRRSHK